MKERKLSYDYDELIRSGNGTLFEEHAGRLPLPNMLMMDRITYISTESGKYNKGVIKAELDIKPELWFFACHFKDDTVMPGSLGLDAMFQLTGFYLTYLGHEGKGRALGCDKLSFFGEVLPSNQIVSYEINVKRVINLKMIMIIADGSMYVDGKEIYTVENMKVGLYR